MRKTLGIILTLSSLVHAAPREVGSLLAAAATFEIERIESVPANEVVREGGAVLLRGAGGGSATFVLHPPGGHWDFDAWNYVRLDFTNTGKHLARIDGRLDNPDAVDWSHSLPGTAVIPAKSDGTLGFALTRPGSSYDGPEVFHSQSARPNGHRSHWRPFDPARVRALRLVVRAAGPFELRFPGLAASWPAGSAANADLEKLPYLDRFGQVRALDWPGKLRSVADLRTALEAEEKQSAKTLPGMNRFGGWKDGPRLEATGFFRTTKLDGRWWFVDPEGCLFWSQGANSVGLHSATPSGEARRELFAWLPEPADPLHSILISQPKAGRQPQANFLQTNLARVWGEAATERARKLNHQRLRSWGINTLGAWSDPEMTRQSLTPYTLIAGVWHPNLNHGRGSHMLPDPFEPRFEKSLRASLEALAWAREDPWCLGVFIDNELEWANELAPIIFAAAPGQAVKLALVRHLRERHPDIAALNRAWNIQLRDWDALRELEEAPDAEFSGTFTADIESFYRVFADRYFSTCQRLMREILPNHLYLGCRIHRAPPLVIESAAGHVDVLSSNTYANLASAGWLPAATDIPVLIGEFHFGAPDRGVPGAGLCSVHDQRQRGLAYTAYVTGGLLDARVVGTHWFAFPDQSAAGRPGENYQIGLIDVTGRAYPEFTGAVRRLSRHLYETRHRPAASVEAALEKITAE